MRSLSLSHLLPPVAHHSSSPSSSLPPLFQTSAATRAAQPSAILADSEYVARRVKRHLADLERTNYTEPTTGPTAYGDARGAAGAGAGGGDDEAEGPSQLAKDDGARKKKSTMAVRTLLMYRKNLAALLAESVRLSFPSIHCTLSL